MTTTQRFKKGVRSFAALSLISVASFARSETTWFWDGSTAILNGASDNATTTNLNWLSGGYWDNNITDAALTSWTAGDSAVFGGSSASETIIAGTLTIGNMTFGAGSTGAGTNDTQYTLNKGTITLSAPSRFTVNTPTTIYSTLAGSNKSLTLAGAAMLTLSGINTFTGGITMNNNTVLKAWVNSSTTSLGPTNSAVSIASGAMLTVNSANFSGLLCLDNAFTGSGLLKVIFAANTMPRKTTMAGMGNFSGILELANSGNTGDKLDGSGINATDACLQINSGNTLFISAGTMSVWKSVSVTGTGNNENRGAIRFQQGGILAAPVSLVGNASIGADPGAAGAISGDITSGAAGSQVLTLGTSSSTGSLTLSGNIGGGTGTIGLTQTKAGTVMLTGTNTYSAATAVNAGMLAGVAGCGGCSNSAVAVAASCILGIRVDDNTQPWACASLTSAATSTTLAFGFNTPPSTSTAPLKVTGNLGFTGIPAIAVDLANLSAGTYPLILVGGTVPSGTPTVAIGHGLTGTTSWNGKTLNLNVSGTSTLPLKWATDSAGNWDINTTANWKDNTAATTKYLDGTFIGDSVVFDDTYLLTNTTVTLNTTVKPASVTVNNSNYQYTISGTGAIGGKTGLTKSGTHQLNLIGVNTYAGKTRVNGGMLAIYTATGLGANPVSFVADQLTLDEGGVIICSNKMISTFGNRGITLGSRNGTITTWSGATLTLDTGIGGTGGLTKTGPGMLVLSAQSTYTGTTSVNSGTLALGTNHTLDVDNAVTLAGGTLDMGNYTNTLDTLTVTSGSVITLGSGELSFTDSSSVTWTGELALAGTLGEPTLRFGTTSSGLTRTQLARITINGLSVTLNDMGYVVPSPGTVLLLM